MNKVIHHRISNFGPIQRLITDRATEYPSSEIANWCTLFIIRHFPRTSQSPWTNGLLEIQIKNIGTHLKMFLFDIPENWSTHVHFFPYAQFTQPISHMHISPVGIVFHTQPRIALNYKLTLRRNSFRECIAQNCSDMPPLYLYQPFNFKIYFVSCY